MIILERQNCTIEISCCWANHEKSSIEIEWFCLHGEKRKGLGTMYFNEWEKQLPFNIKSIVIKNFDDKTFKFWEKLGFIYSGENSLIKMINIDLQLNILAKIQHTDAQISV
jgi:hypothetical protein